VDLEEEITPEEVKSVRHQFIKKPDLMYLIICEVMFPMCWHEVKFTHGCKELM